MEEVKICSFFGHRTITITQEFYATVKTEVMQSVDFGCRVFYFGGFGEFDALCYEIVTAIQKEKPELGLKRVYCVPLERGLTKRGKYPQEPYEEIIFLTPAIQGWYRSIYFRNCAMIENSDCIIFYAEKRNNSGAYKAYQYAKGKKGKQIVNLFPADNIIL